MAREPYTICGYIASTDEYIPLETTNSWIEAHIKAKIMNDACESGTLTDSDGYPFDEVVVTDADNVIVWVPQENM